MLTYRNEHILCGLTSQKSNPAPWAQPHLMLVHLLEDLFNSKKILDTLKPALGPTLWKAEAGSGARPLTWNSCLSSKVVMGGGLGSVSPATTGFVE